MKFSREDVTFTSHGAALRGWLYRPEGDTPKPGVVMAHGLTAVREMFLDLYAEAFACAGFMTLVYDHFGFGVSDGEPRQSPAPSLQLEGYRDAIAWLRRQSGVDPDRIGVWGSSYSGGQVIMLAAEPLPIRCAVAQVPGFSMGGLQLSAATVAEITAAIQNGRLDDVIPAATATADGLGIMYQDDAHDWFTRVSRERAPTWRNEVRIGALTEPFEPIDFLVRTRIPLRCIVAPDDRLTPPDEGIKIAATVPLIDLVQISGGHFTAYEAGFDESARLAVDWFARHLAD
ncbi:alpha/beta fold hydrolase [uncultured Rhodoblastus sp.]|uniref:alpha/beta hydrolase n=1 Tax=uncultured Rhodoblastus sp. TaxID=543037 RepID=UPI0025E995F7|nr:alpha/beta fold hydrolase [uncultured Rhodoblastus sp.]